METTMSAKYALVYFFDPSKGGPTEGEYQEWVEFEESAKDAGQLVHGAGLHPSSKGRSVSIRDGETAVDDGVPAGEAVAGYYVVEVPDEDTATFWAQRVPTAPTAASKCARSPRWREDGVRLARRSVGGRHRGRDGRVVAWFAEFRL
jgi:hypothetical protein